MIKSTYKPAYLKVMLIIGMLPTALICAENSEQYYGKSLYKLRTEDATLDTILKKAWWDYYFFNIKSFFDSPSPRKIARMKQHILFLREKINSVSACIDSTQKKLDAIRDPEFFGDGNNPGLEIAANIMLFPFLLLAHGSAEREKKRLRYSLIIMEKTKRQLEYWADEIQLLVNGI